MRRQLNYPGVIIHCHCLKSVVIEAFQEERFQTHFFTLCYIAVIKIEIIKLNSWDRLQLPPRDHGRNEGAQK